jgi:L-ascorbate metabolism protein UlaG (beta-lactamase superfamily)
MFEKDTIQTDAGDLEIIFIGHGTLMLKFNEKILHIDPWSQLADYADMPKADIILITHEHQDHLDPKAVEDVRTETTALILTRICAERIDGGTVMKNGDEETIDGIRIEAVPAYNIEHMRSPGVPYHPRGDGNGYIITFGNRRVYIAGDTENTPELKAIKNIDVVFLPMNLPYTMVPEMAADACRALKPGILYPYHFGQTDTSQLKALLKDEPGVEIRIRKMA